jgi:hypothetical protein
MNVPYVTGYGNTSTTDFAKFAHHTFEPKIKQAINARITAIPITGVQLHKLTNGSTVAKFLVVFQNEANRALLGPQLVTLFKNANTDSSTKNILTDLKINPSKTVTVTSATGCSLLSPCGKNEDCSQTLADPFKSICQCKKDYLRINGKCESETLKDWMIAVIVIAVFVFLLIVIVICALIRMHRKRTRTGKANVSGIPNKVLMIFHDPNSAHNSR